MALVGTVFWPVLDFDFVRWDDDINITQNPLLTAPWSWQLAGQLFDSDQALRFKPLHWLCFRGLHAAFDFNPAAWHAFNLVLHAVAAALFYLVLRRIFRVLQISGTWPPLIGAGLWALHPLRAEVVGWSTASPYSLTAVMLLASFACYLEARERAFELDRWLVAAWVFAVLAYASYPVGATYGLWLMAVDRWLRPAGAGPLPRLNLRWWFKHACFLAPAGLVVALTLWSRFTMPGIFTAAPTVESVGFASRVGMALASLAYLARVLFWPSELTPNMPPLEMGMAVAWQVGLGALLAVIGLGLAWPARQKRPLFALVIIGFAGLALPCLGWTERPSWPVDRYSYLIHLVLVGGLVGGLSVWAGAVRARRQLLLAMVVGSAIISAVMARKQVMIWQDSPALFVHMEQHPHFADNPRQQGHVYVLWGSYEMTAGRPERAAALFNSAQAAYLAAIKAAVVQLNYREALSLSTHLDHFFTLSPVMHRERGAWLLRLGRKSEARVELNAACPGLPDDPRLASLLEEAKE